MALEKEDEDAVWKKSVLHSAPESGVKIKWERQDGDQLLEKFKKKFGNRWKGLR